MHRPISELQTGASLSAATGQKEGIMSPTYSLKLYGSAEADSRLPVFPDPWSVGSGLEKHTTLPQPIVSVDPSICSLEALRSPLEPKCYRLVPVHRDGGPRGSMTPARTFVLLPFSLDELLKRVLGLVNASSSKGLEKVIVFGDVGVDLAKMEVIREGRKVALTVQEFKTLRFLILNPERVISRDELLNKVWGYERYPVTRTVDNHILKLRQKLEKDPAHPVHFRTVHGLGYKFVGGSTPDKQRRATEKEGTNKEL